MNYNITDKSKELFLAIFKLQQECPPIYKRTKGYGYNFADMNTIWEAIKPLMEKYGLGHIHRTVVREFESGDVANVLETCIIHESGGVLDSTIILDSTVQLKGQNAFQTMGSCLSYFKRYQLCLMLGILAEQDNDAAGKQIKKESLGKRILNEAEMIEAEKLVKQNKSKFAQIKKQCELTDIQLQRLNRVYNEKNVADAL